MLLERGGHALNVAKVSRCGANSRDLCDVMVPTVLGDSNLRCRPYGRSMLASLPDWLILSLADPPDRLRCENGAGEGIRTLDPNLGKVVLYP